MNAQNTLVRVSSGWEFLFWGQNKAKSWVFSSAAQAQVQNCEFDARYKTKQTKKQIKGVKTTSKVNLSYQLKLPDILGFFLVLKNT